MLDTEIKRERESQRQRWQRCTSNILIEHSDEPYATYVKNQLLEWFVKDKLSQWHRIISSHSCVPSSCVDFNISMGIQNWHETHQPELNEWMINEHTFKLIAKVHIPIDGYNFNLKKFLLEFEILQFYPKWNHFDSQYHILKLNAIETIVNVEFSMIRYDTW